MESKTTGDPSEETERIAATTTPVDQNGVEESSSYLEHLSIDRVFGRVWRVFRKQWTLFLSVAALAILVQYALGTILSIVFLKLGWTEAQQQGAQQTMMFWQHQHVRRFLEDAAAAEQEAEDDAVVAGDDLWYYDNAMDEYEYDTDTDIMFSSPWAILGYVIRDVIYYLLLAVSDGALIRAVTEIYTLQTPAVGSSLRAGIRRLGPLIGAPLLLWLALLIPFVLVFLVIAAVPIPLVSVLLMLCLMGLIIFIGVVTYHIYPAIMVEQCGVIESIQRSWRLSEGHRFYIFSIQIIFGLAKLVVQVVIATAILSVGGTAGSIVGNILYLTYLTLFAAWGSILQAVVYFSVRVVKEGLSVDQLSQEAGISLDTPYGALNEEKETGNEDNAATVISKTTPLV